MTINDNQREELSHCVDCLNAASVRIHRSELVLVLGLILVYLVFLLAIVI